MKLRDKGMHYSTVLHTNLNKGMDGLIIGPISNEELHVFIFNLGGRRSDILHPHVAHFLLKLERWL